MNNTEKVKKTLDKISPSMCAAKWYNASIWLSNGKTASCHHPLGHKIPLTELKDNPSALHNTNFKKEQRKKMLEGDRPDECSYCWRVEDEEGTLSDRVYQSQRYSDKDIKKLSELPYDANIAPKTLEITFDNLCNLACSYCNSEFSSTWSKNIQKHGPYKNMRTEGGFTYEHTSDFTLPTGHKNIGNTYVEKFMEWFQEIRGELQELRVSGGEPSRSPHFWKFLQECENDTFNFAVNSNLIMPEHRLVTLIDAADKFKGMDMYTSAESYGPLGEFVRDGFSWDQWVLNCDKCYESKKLRTTNVMMTISALSVWTVKDFLKFIIDKRKHYNDINYFMMTVNILRFPSFQSVNIIEQSYKEAIAKELEEELELSTDWMQKFEIDQYKRLIIYLRKVDRGYEDKDESINKRKDFKNFVNQYELRRKKPTVEYFTKELLNWYKKEINV
jgi:organic radical activating enzyme